MSKCFSAILLWNFISLLKPFQTVFHHNLIEDAPKEKNLLSLKRIKFLLSFYDNINISPLKMRVRTYVVMLNFSFFFVTLTIPQFSNKAINTVI